MSESPAYIGGCLDRGMPCYSEDIDDGSGELLGKPAHEINAPPEEV